MIARTFVRMFTRMFVPVLAVATTAFAFAPAQAQLAKPRTLEELKAEIQTRADRRAYPVALLEPAEVREALGSLKSLDRDEWARAWSAIGDRHSARGKALESTDRAGAIKHHKLAMEYHFFARFPLENSPEKVRSYRKGLAAFADYARLLDPPIETVRLPYDGREIVGYLRLPKAAPRPVPVVLTIGGLDGRKENASIRNDAYLEHGVAYLAVDMPGTGEAGTKVIVPGAERELSRVLDFIASRADLDARRVVAYGGSWGGHWSARLAYSERERLRGAVVHGGPVHGYFQPDWQRKALGTREYLFELFEARAAVYGVEKLDDFLAYGPKMSLLATGVLDKPSAPMFVINGLKDSQVPAEDLFLLMRHGAPKEVWINPEGGHMGRTNQLSDQRIFDTVTLPWVVRRLKE